jgi:hypothetical protein
MKSRLLFISTIAATAATLGVSGIALSQPLDAQASAAALLSRPHTPVDSQVFKQPNASSTSVAEDAHATAVRLLTGSRTAASASASVRSAQVTATRTPLDAHAQASALLSGARNSQRDRSRITSKGELLGEHPAVLVARHWGTRGIDPNSFIVAHPAGLALVHASPTG